MKKRFSKGFTLAEVLITLGIIGVVAAMTIPTLMAKFEKQQYVTQLKETYSLLSQALQQLKADEGVSRLSDSDIITCNTATEDFQNDCIPRSDIFLNKYFKIIKDCGSGYDKDCFAKDYYSIDKGVGPIDANGLDGYKVILSNGTSILFLPARTNKFGVLYVDVNGLKKPNLYGRDFFSMAFYYDGSIDSVDPICKQGNTNRYGVTCGGMGTSAKEARQNIFDMGSDYAIHIGKILNDGWKMDY